MSDEVKTTGIEVGPDKNLEAIMVAKDLTRRTGILTEIQIVQLRMWPLAILNAESSECSFDYEKRILKFKISGFDGERPTDLAERLVNLRRCIKFLLGPEYKIQVRLGKERLDTP